MVGVDKSDMLGVLRSFRHQCQEGWELGNTVKLARTFFDAIFVVGMGGSALPGDILKSVVPLSIPVHVIKDYTVPSYLSKDSLVFVISYSGNTEETLSALEEVLKKKATVVVITSGGTLEKIATQKKLPLITVPGGLSPRAAWGYQLFPLFRILDTLKLATLRRDVNDAFDVLDPHSVEDDAQDYAKHLKGKIPLIYTSAKLYAVGYKWKISLNENAKIPAFSNVFPEFNHNEINAFGGLKFPFHAFFLEDAEDHPRIKKRMNAVRKIAEKAGVEVTHIVSGGHCLLARALWLISLGDFVSYYVALAYRRDPTPVPVIEDLKGQLAGG